MPFICKNCGSLTWREVVERVEDFILSDYGDYEEVAHEYGDLIERMCAECFSDSLIEFEDVSPEVAEKLLSIKDGKERLKTFFFLVLEGKIKANISKEDVIRCLRENLGVKEDEMLAKVM